MKEVKLTKTKTKKRKKIVSEEKKKKSDVNGKEPC